MERKKGKGRYRREEKQSVKNFHCHVHLAASTMGIQGKEKKKWGQKERGEKKGRKSWEWKGEIKGKQKFHPKPGILQAVIFQLIEKPLNKKSSLENRKCCDYKVEHFISTNWSLNVLWESNCSVQIGRKKYNTAWRRIFFPFWFITAFFFFFFLFCFFPFY